MAAFLFYSCNFYGNLLKQLYFSLSRWLVYGGVFFGTLFLLIVQVAFLSVEVCICDFFVKFRKDGYILTVLVGYLLRGLFRIWYLWQLYYKELSMGVKWPFSMPTKWEHLFLGCFSLEYFRRGELPVFNGHSTNQRYFNSALASTVFSKNFLTNFFFG